MGKETKKKRISAVIWLLLVPTCIICLGMLGAGTRPTLVFTIFYLLTYIFPILATILLVFQPRPTEEISVAPLELPDHFLGLPSNLRKEALYFTWTIKGPPSISGKRFLYSASMFFSVLFMLGYGIFMLSTVVTAQSIEDWSLEGDVLGFLFFATIFLWAIAFVLLRYRVNQCNAVLQAIKNDEVRLGRFQGLKKLATDFVESQYRLWIDAMSKVALSKAKAESNIEPDNTFLLLPFDPTPQTKMPSPKIPVTYILSNRFVVITSNILFDIKETSYKLVDKDTPQYIVSDKNTWQSEEFHYQDVVEVTYSPSTSNDKTVKIGDKEYPVAGYLTMTLVNGSTKKYPTTKEDVSSFIRIAREKIREAKTAR